MPHNSERKTKLEWATKEIYVFLGYIFLKGETMQFYLSTILSVIIQRVGEIGNLSQRGNKERQKLHYANLGQYTV